MSFWNIPSIEPKLAYRWYISFGDRNIEKGQTNNALPHWVCKKVTKPSYQIKHTEHKYLGVHRFNYPTHLEWQPITLTLVDVYNFDYKFFAFERTRKDIDSNSTNNISVNNTLKEATPAEINNQLTIANRSTQLFFYYFLKDAGYIDPNEGIYQDLLARFTKTLTKRKMVGAFIGQNEDYLNGIRSDDPNKIYIDQNSWNTLDINEINNLGEVTEKWKLFNPLITSVKFGELAYETDGVVDISIDLVYDWAELVPTSYKDIDNPRDFKDEIRKEIKNIEEQVIQEKLEKQYIFDEIQKRYIFNEKALKESQLRLNKNNYFKNQKDIISKTFVEHKKYSNIKELRSDDRNEILRLKKEILDKEQLQDLRYDIQRKEVSINEAQKEIQLTEEELRDFRKKEREEEKQIEEKKENKRKQALEAAVKRQKEKEDALIMSKRARENIINTTFLEESDFERERRADEETNLLKEQSKAKIKENQILKQQRILAESQIEIRKAERAEAKSLADERKEQDKQDVQGVIEFLRQDAANKKAEAEAPEKRRQELERALLKVDTFNK